MRALQPWRLWRETPIELTPRVGALLGFVALWAVLFTLVQVTIGAAQVLSDWWTNGTMRAGVAGILPLAGGTLQERVALAVPHLATTLLIGASVWAFVQIFQETMSRAHVRWGQVLRVVVFAWLPVMAWQTLSAAIDLGLTRISAGGPWITARRFGGSLFWGHDPFAGLVWCMFLPGEFVALCLAVASLCIGLDRYLRLRRGRWIGLVTGATIALGWLTLVFATYSYGHSTWMRLGIPRAWPGLWSVLGNLIRASIIR